MLPPHRGWVPASPMPLRGPEILRDGWIAVMLLSWRIASFAPISVGIAGRVFAVNALRLRHLPGKSTVSGDHSI